MDEDPDDTPDHGFGDDVTSYAVADKYPEEHLRTLESEPKRMPEGNPVLNWLDARQPWAWMWIRVTFNLVALWIAALVLRSGEHPFWTVALIAWGILGLVHESLKFNQFALTLTLGDIQSETRCHTDAEVWLFVDRILDHPAVVRVFERLRAIDRIPSGTTHAEWRDALIQRLREREKIQDQARSWKRVTFSFHGGKFRVDGATRRQMALDYQLLIPDEALESGLTARVGRRTDEEMDYAGLRIRLVIVAGEMRVQVGKWDEKTCDRHAGETVVSYRAWDTVARFPLLLNPGDHAFPPRFLSVGHDAPDGLPSLWGDPKAMGRHIMDYRRVIAAGEDRACSRVDGRLDREFRKRLRIEGFAPIRSLHATTWRSPYVMLSLHGPGDRTDLHRSLGSEQDASGPAGR